MVIGILLYFKIGLNFRMVNMLKYKVIILMVVLNFIYFIFLLWGEKGRVKDLKTPDTP